MDPVTAMTLLCLIRDAQRPTGYFEQCKFEQCIRAPQKGAGGWQPREPGQPRARGTTTLLANAIFVKTPDGRECLAPKPKDWKPG